jgi:hypothetical protein
MIGMMRQMMFNKLAKDLNKKKDLSTLAIEERKLLQLRPN